MKSLNPYEEGLQKKVVKFFETSDKTNWGKIQLVSALKDLEISYLKDVLRASLKKKA